MVFTIVVVGGVTRLTESGLSIVEWRPVTGMLPPMTQQAWEEEFAKYQKYPEYSQNPDMDLAHFKFIFFWEWAHRVLARSVGIVFAVPMVYFWSKGYFKKQPRLQLGLLGLFCLGGAQGALGWYMVKSGLDPKLVEQRRKATVSAYRLAAHLSLALVLFASMVRLSLAIRYGARPKAMVLHPEAAKWLWDMRLLARTTMGWLGCTIVSGAFVAGLDAGLLYNDEFPWMSGGVLPPPDHLFQSDLQPVWRNFLENPSAAQTLHRVMAGISISSVVGLNILLRYKLARHKATAGSLGEDVMLPPRIRKAVMGVTHAALFQVVLGVATIMLYVPVPVAALHQANAVITLGVLIRLLAMLSKRGGIRM